MAGIFAGTIAVQGVLVLAAEKYGTQAIVNTFVGGILVFLIYQMYTLILANLESKLKQSKKCQKSTNMNYTIRWTQAPLLAWQPLEFEIRDFTEARAVLARIMAL
jgi:hypothetical protein